MREATGELKPLWSVPSSSHGKRFVDFQDDVAVSDIELAEREGYRSVEHLKRYTTLGMGTDQGKLSNINGLAILSELLQAEIPQVGTTTFRPRRCAASAATRPATPVPMTTTSARCCQ